MIIDSSGNVLVGGIVAGNAGTISLNVGNAGSTSGGLQLWGTSTDTHYVQFGDESGTAANHYRGFMGYAHNGDSLTFGTASTERMRIDSSGRVGIGTSSPKTSLSIETSGTQGVVSPIVTGQASGVTYGGLYTVRDGAGDQRGLALQVFTANVGLNEVLRINSAGSVGIGTDDPSRLLHCNGSFKLGTNGFIEYGGTYPYTINIENTAGAGDVKIQSASGNNKILLQGDTSGIDFYTGATERMRIDSSGNVGIGTSSPSHKFHVQSNTDNDYVARFEGNTFNSAGVWTGIGIGGEADNTKSAIIFEDIGVSYSRGKLHLAVNNELNQNNATKTDAKLTISNTGNVGIGTDDPQKTLDVRGTFAISNNSLSYWDFDRDSNGSLVISDTNTPRMTIDTSGNVTINNNLSVTGSLSKGSGSFKIDHPLPEKKDTHHLVHSFVEAPQADNIYRGKIDLSQGQATVNLDEAGRMTEGTFVLLNGNIQCFTSNESGWTAIRGKVEGNILTIEAQDAECTDTISWLVIGERIDQHMIDTEWTDENGRVITEPIKKVESTPEEEEEATIIENN